MNRFDMTPRATARRSIGPGKRRLACATVSVVLLGLLMTASCRPTPAPDGRPTPVYDSQTGRLKELISDRNGDGKADVHGFMDGEQVQRIEVDRNADGKTDRWEYYAPSASGKPGASPVLTRTEEANGPAQRVTRREFYLSGAIDHVEDDTDNNGRADKWETYVGGVLTRLDLDVAGKGFPDRRFVYGKGGVVTRIDEDSDGDGVFQPLVTKAPTTSVQTVKTP
jgi:hypothetical protein